jgi:hypothetical protein
LIGLIPAIHNMGWQLPQRLLAKRISRMEKVKSYVVKATILAIWIDGNCVLFGLRGQPTQS